ncbi:hypothetical protein VPH35_092192 [Triticum aestivum]
MWSLLLHDVVAITVFFLLVFAFYAFFAPFLGTQVPEYVAVGIYTPMIGCTSFNPADPGIMVRFEDGCVDVPANNDGLAGINLSTCGSSLDGHPNQRGTSVGEANIHVSSQLPKKRSRCFHFGGLVCALFVKEDCRKSDESEKQAIGEEALFCTLCNAEIDVHMPISILWWMTVASTTLGATPLYISPIEETPTYLQNTLSNLIFGIITGIFTLLSLVACIPLGELFFFHMILIRKGISTYGYVVAMRAMSEGIPEDEEGANIIYSSSNSATTGFSAGSSPGLHHKGARCTPPRIIMISCAETFNQDAVIPHLDPGMVPSTVDPDAAGYAERANKAKKPFTIGARILAKLDINEVTKVQEKPWAPSSVFPPIDVRHGHEADISSSGNASVKSCMSIDYSESCKPGCYETGTQTASSLSSLVHIHKLTPHANFCAAPHPGPPPERPAPGITRPPVPTTYISNKSMFQSAISYVRENRRVSIVWDQEAGQYVSMPMQTTGNRPGVELPVRNPSFLANPMPGRNNNTKIDNPILELLHPSGQPSERLMYTTDQSIFFGGPIPSTTIINAERNEAGTRARAEGSRDPSSHQRDIRGEKARTSSFTLFEPRNF